MFWAATKGKEQVPAFSVFMFKYENTDSEAVFVVLLLESTSDFVCFDNGVLVTFITGEIKMNASKIRGKKLKLTCLLICDLEKQKRLPPVCFTAKVIYETCLLDIGSHFLLQFCPSFLLPGLADVYFLERGKHTNPNLCFTHTLSPIV